MGTRRLKPVIFAISSVAILLLAFQNCGQGFETLKSSEFGSTGVVGDGFQIQLPSLNLMAPAQLKANMPARTFDVSTPLNPVLFASGRYFGLIDNKLYSTDSKFSSLTPVPVSNASSINLAVATGNHKNLFIQYVDSTSGLLTYGVINPITLEVSVMTSAPASTIAVSYRMNPTNGDIYLLTRDASNSQIYHFNSATRTTAAATYANQILSFVHTANLNSTKVPVRFNSTCGVIDMANRSLRTYGACQSTFNHYSVARDTFLVYTNTSSPPLQEIGADGVVTPRLVGGFIYGLNLSFQVYSLANQLYLVSHGATGGIQALGIANFTRLSGQADYDTMLVIDGAASRVLGVEKSTGSLTRNDSLAPIFNALGTLNALVLQFTPSRRYAVFRVTDATNTYRYGVLDFQGGTILSQFSSSALYDFQTTTEQSAVFTNPSEPVQLRRFANLSVTETLESSAVAASTTLVPNEDGSFAVHVSSTDGRKVINRMTSTVEAFSPKLMAREAFLTINLQGAQRLVRYAVDRSRSMLLLESYDYDGRQMQTAQVPIPPEAVSVFNGSHEKDRIAIFRAGRTVIRFAPLSGASDTVVMPANVNLIGAFKDATLALSNGQICPIGSPCTIAAYPASFVPALALHESEDRMILKSSAIASQMLVLARNAGGAQLVGEPFLGSTIFTTSGNFALFMNNSDPLIVNLQNGQVVPVAVPAGDTNLSIREGKTAANGNFATTMFRAPGNQMIRAEVAPATGQIVSTTSIVIPAGSAFDRTFSQNERPESTNLIYVTRTIDVPDRLSYTLRIYNTQGAEISAFPMGICLSFSSYPIGTGERFNLISCYVETTAGGSIRYRYFLVDSNSANTQVREIQGVNGASPSTCKPVGNLASICSRPKNPTEIEFVKYDWASLTQTPFATLPIGYGLNSIASLTDRKFIAHVAPANNYTVGANGHFVQNLYSTTVPGKPYLIEW